jgi:hypothetical protein
MANRNFASGGKIYSMHVMPVLLDLQITIGASGAVSSFSGLGVQSVTKSATGTYAVTLQDNYNALIGIVKFSPQIASGVSGLDSIEQVGAMVNSSNPSAAGAAITIQCVLNGVVANPTSGAIVKLGIYLNNSSVQ